MKILLKVFVFCSVSLLTWMATRSILARQARGKVESSSASAQIDPATSTVRSVATTTQFKPGPAFTQIELGTSGAYAESYLRSGGISVEGGFATAKAHVSVADKRPGITFVWRFQVVDEGENTLSGQVYDKQMFTVDDNGQKEVDFEDVIAVPMGAYRVEMVLYEKPPGEDLSFLNNDPGMQGYQKIRLVKLMKR